MRGARTVRPNNRLFLKYDLLFRLFLRTKAQKLGIPTPIVKFCNRCQQKNILLCASSLLLFLPFTLSLFFGTLLSALLCRCDARYNIRKGIVDYSDGPDLGRTEE